MLLAYIEEGRKNRSRDTKRAFSVTEDSIKQGIDNFKKHLADFLGLKEQVNKLGLGSFDPKLYRLVKGNGKTGNYSILTRVLLKAGPRPSGPRAATAQRLGGPRPTTARRPGGLVLIFHNFFVQR